MTNGRGAWTELGHSTGFSDYRYVKDHAVDGSLSNEDLNAKAVWSAVKAIQTEVNRYVMPKLKVDGFYGPVTAESIKEVQHQLGLTQDGVMGPRTAEKLFTESLLPDIAQARGVDPSILYGQTLHESSFDPGARGYDHSPDSGLVQINLESETTVSWDQAFDPKFAFTYSANRLKAAMDKYKSKPELQLKCAVAAHNTPVGADAWFRSGVAPSKALAAYVADVLAKAKDF